MNIPKKRDADVVGPIRQIIDNLDEAKLTDVVLGVDGYTVAIFGGPLRSPLSWSAETPVAAAARVIETFDALDAGKLKATITMTVRVEIDITPDFPNRHAVKEEG